MMYVPFVLNNLCNDASNSGKFHNWRKRFIVDYILLLSESLGHQTSSIQLNITICLIFDFVYLTTCNGLLPFWNLYNVSCVFFSDGIQFCLHGMFPFRNAFYMMLKCWLQINIKSIWRRRNMSYKVGRSIMEHFIIQKLVIVWWHEV